MELWKFGLIIIANLRSISNISTIRIWKFYDSIFKTLNRLDNLYLNFCICLIIKLRFDLERRNDRNSNVLPFDITT